MKLVCRKVVLFVMAVAASINFTACMRNLDNLNADEVSKLLKDKYGEEFVVSSIGNRLASDRADTLIAYCYPKSNPEVIFKAVMNTSHELISDDYPISLIEIEAKRIIENQLKNKGIETTVLVAVAKIADTFDYDNIDFMAIIEDNPKMSLTFTTLMPEGTDAGQVYDAVVEVLENLYSGNKEMMLGTTLWIYDREAYNECVKDASKLPSINDTLLNEHNPITNITIAIRNGEVIINRDDFMDK